MDINEILQQLGDEVLSEGTRVQISEAFNAAVQAKVDQQVAEKVELELTAQDNEYADELKSLLEAIDVDHSNKAQAIFENIQKQHQDELRKLDEERTKDLSTVIEHYESQLNEQSREIMEGLIDTVDMYLEEVIDEAIPHEQLKEMAENRYAKQLLDQIKKVAVVDESFANKEIREALQDGDAEIKQLRQEKQQALEEARQVKVNNFLTEKTSSMPKEKASFITNVLKDKDLDFIEENFSYTERMFERRDSKEREEVRAKTQLVTENVDRPSKDDEKDTTQQVDHRMQTYIDGLTR